MDNKNFVHLHVHTEFSILDGFAQATKWAARAKELGFNQLAVSDHGNLDGSIYFQKACDAEEIKPIFGCEAYIVPNMVVHEKGEKRFHITLLVKNKTGWENLSQMLTYANLQGFYYKPRIDPATLLDYCEGLVVMTACTSGFINMDGGIELISDLKDKGVSVFAEVMPLMMDEQVEMNKVCIEISNQLDIPLVASNDCHYPLKENSIHQEVLLAMQSKAKWKDPDRWKFSVDDLYLKTADEMVDSFLTQGVLSEAEIQSAMDNSKMIAEMCNFRLEPQEPHLPIVSVPKYSGESETDQIINLTLDGLERRAADHEWIRDNIDSYNERIEEEFSEIIPKFTRYFLIVWELVNWCEENDILLGPGRGSSAGSLVSYCLGITHVDPIKYKLIFSRFISPGRIDLPDIDMDFEDIKRPLILDHLEDIYGKWNVLEVSNFLKMKGRGALTNVSRVFDVPIVEVRKAADVIVTRSSGDFRSDFSIIDAFETFEDGKAFKAKYPEVTELAADFEGQVSTTGRHAAAMCVSGEDFRSGKNAVVVMRRGHKVCNWSKDDAEFMGLMKLDILGLNGLTILNQSRRLIKERHGVDINYNLVDLEDSKIYDEFTKGNTVGIFQFNSPGMIKLCRDIEADKFEDVVALNALHRPGALRAGFTQIYRNRKFGLEPTTYVHPWIEGITKDTFGLIIYQEQVMRLMYELGGLPWKTADTIRKVISKSKGTEEFMKFKDQFISGCKRLGTLGEEDAELIYEELKSMGCLTGDTIIYRSSLDQFIEVTIREAYETMYGYHNRIKCYGWSMLSMHSDGQVRTNTVKKIFKTGRKKVFLIRTNSNKTIRATENHRFIDGSGDWKTLKEFRTGDWIRVTDLELPKDISKMRFNNGYHTQLEKIAGIKSAGEQDTYDIEMEREPRNYIANNFVSHNSYSFNLCLAGDTELIRSSSGSHAKSPSITIKKLYENFISKGAVGKKYRSIGVKVLQMDSDGRIRPGKVKAVHKSGEQPLRKITMLSGKEIKATVNHRFYVKRPCNDGTDERYCRVSSLRVGDEMATMGTKEERFSVGYPVGWDEIISIGSSPSEETYDVEMDTETHNFIANGMVSHNSHAASYAMIAVWMMYLKVYYPTEFMCATLSYGPDKKKLEQINEAKRLDIKILLPDINISDATIWTIDAEGNMISPFTEIKGVGDKAAICIMEERGNNGPYSSVEDLNTRTPNRPVTKKVRQLLVDSMAFSTSENKLNMSNEELDELSSLFDFELSNDPLYKFHGVIGKIEEKIIQLPDNKVLAPIRRADDQKGNQYYFGRMERLTVGYKEAVTQGKVASGFGSLGSIYGSLRDDTDFKMIVFGSKIYEEKKYAIEHCDGEAMFTYAGMTRSRSALLTQSAWFGSDLLAGRIEKSGLKFLENRGGGGEPFFLEGLHSCSNCELVSECTNPVSPTKGSKNIMIIGEAPGRDEDRIGEGFQGKAGAVLDNGLEGRGLPREWFHISNFCKCWPSKTRTPKKDHLSKCSQWIKSEIDAVKPFLILSFGNTGNLFFRGESSGIMSLNGQTIWSDEYNCWITYCVHPAVVTYDPANKETFDEGMDEFANRVLCLGFGE